MQNHIFGTYGDDVIFGTRDGENILGRDGNDTIRGAGGFDFLWGDGGDDVFVYRPEDLAADVFDFVVDGGSGTDSLLLQADGSANFELRNLADGGGVEQIEILAFGGTKKGIQLQATVPIELFSFMDTRSRNPGQVTISGSEHAGVQDVLVLRPRLGNWEKSDFSNLEFINWGSEDQIVIDLSSGASPFGISVTGTRLRDRIVGDQWRNQVNGYRGNDSILGAGGNDKLIGGLGRDRLRGGAGDDKLKGQSGEDRLLGGKGSDRIFGGKHHDTLDGGLGDDILSGGTGADDFVFKGKFGKDIILDFEGGSDTLRLDQAIWGGGISEKQLLDQFSSVEDGALVLDFGAREIRIAHFSDTNALINDISFFEA